MSEHAEAKHAFAVTTLGTRTLQRLSSPERLFLVAFSPLPALAACTLRVYSRRLSQGLAAGLAS